MENQRHRVYVALGSNLGDRLSYIQSAIGLLGESGSCKIATTSKIYETEPWGYAAQGRFLNCVFKLQTVLTPDALLKTLRGIEKKLGRERNIPNGPRTMDLDILFYDNLVVSADGLVIPHPRLHERMFVMKPLCDIAPDFVHPVLGTSCIRIFENLKKKETEPSEWSQQF